MCPVAMTFRRFILSMSLLCGYPSELTVFRCISDLGELAGFIDLIFQAQGGIDSLLPGPEDTSLAEYMLHRALIWSHNTDPAKYVRTKTNVLQVMSRIISDDEGEGSGVEAWSQAAETARIQREGAWNERKVKGGSETSSDESGSEENSSGTDASGQRSGKDASVERPAQRRVQSAPQIPCPPAPRVESPEKPQAVARHPVKPAKVSQASGRAVGRSAKKSGPSSPGSDRGALGPVSSPYSSQQASDSKSTLPPIILPPLTEDLAVIREARSYFHFAEECVLHGYVPFTEANALKQAAAGLDKKGVPLTFKTLEELGHTFGISTRRTLAGGQPQ